MQVNNPPIFDQGLVRNDRKGQQAVKSAAPATDKVMDLTATENLQTELNTRDTQFIRMESKGQDVFLDITRMPKTEKDALIAEIKNKVSGANKFDDFDPKTFFTLTNQNRISFGTPTQSGPVADIKSSQTVLDKSLTSGNTQQQAIFGVMNGDEKVLNKQDASSKVGAQNKPAEWYNGFQISQNADGQYDVSTYISPEDKSGQSYDLNTDGYKGKTGVDAYKSMLRDDFNFNGALTDINKAADGELGPDATPEERLQHREDFFVESVVRKFSPQHPNLNDAQLKSLAENVWSYANKGTDKQGNMDIGEMQGMLKELDPEMVKSGSNNANSGYGRFTVTGEDGTSFSLPKGDPFHGRGTILQTRHLLEGFKAEGPVKLGFATPPPELQGYKKTILLADNSSSMGAHMQHLSGVIKAGGIEGSLNVGTYIDKDKPMIWSNASGNSSSTPVSFNPTQAETLLDQQGNAHVAYKNAGANLSPEAKVIAGEREQLTKDIAAEEKRMGSLSNLIETQPDRPDIDKFKNFLTESTAKHADLQNQLKAKDTEFQQELTSGLERAPGSAFIFGKESMNESGIIAGISALENQPNAPANQSSNSNQLILFTDETDASTQADLTRLQDLAKQKGYDVKVVFSKGANFSIVNVNTITSSQSQATNARVTANSVDYALNWGNIATQQNAPSYQWDQTGL